MAQPSTYPTPGETVRITAGTLTGKCGIVTAIEDDRDVVYVEIAGIERPFISHEVSTCRAHQQPAARRSTSR